MTLKFKPFEQFEIPETLRVEMTFKVSLDDEGDLWIRGADGEASCLGPEQWKVLTERVQVEEEPEPWEKVRGMLIRFGFVSPAADLSPEDFQKMAEVLELTSPGA